MFRTHLLDLRLSSVKPLYILVEDILATRSDFYTDSDECRIHEDFATPPDCRPNATLPTVAKKSNTIAVRDWSPAQQSQWRHDASQWSS